MPQQTSAFPSLGRRVLLSVLNSAGPYLVNKLVKRLEQPLNDYLQRENAALTQALASPEVSLSRILKVQLLNLLPDVFSSVKSFGQFHVALFFIWGKYYELSKRLARIAYKYELGAEGQHQISYLRPGRVIMVAIVIQLALFLVRVVRSVRQAYKLHASAQRGRQSNP